jgi:pyridoxal phosphate enzyme (YggS family)
MEISNLELINSKVVSYGATLLPVVKNRTNEEIKFLYEFGFREFGENRLTDFNLHKTVYKDIDYHFIAPIQSRKLKEIVKNFKYLHTISRKKEIDILEKLDIDCNYLIQVNIDNDPKKSGVTKDEVFNFYEYSIEKKIAVVGLMTIPDINSEQKTVFSEMHHINEKLIKDYGYKGELSMGMSNDYEVALDYGATIVRIGTKLFT